MNYKLIDNLRKKLKEKKPTVGGWIQSPSLINAEILAKNGYDWIAIDMEHGQINYSEHENLVRVIESNNCVGSLLKVTEAYIWHLDILKHYIQSLLPLIQSSSR